MRATCAPDAASSTAIASPMPDEAPTTIGRLPAVGEVGVGDMAERGVERLLEAGSGYQEPFRRSQRAKKGRAHLKRRERRARHQDRSWLRRSNSLGRPPVR